MSTVSTPQPIPQRICKRNSKRVLFIFFDAVVIMLASAGMQGAYKKFSSLQNEMAQSQLSLSQYQKHLQYMNQRLNHYEAQAFAKQEQASDLRAKSHNHNNRLNRIEHFLSQQSDTNSKIKEQNLIKELKIHKDMYIQAQQKLQAYEQHLLALTQELQSQKEQNHITRQEQAKMKAEHQELIKKLSQTKASPQVSVEALEKALESRLSQFVYNDYELEQKVKDLQKAVESSAKIGELKALEVYYDDRINDLNNVIQNIPKISGGKGKVETVNPQVKQELAKLNLEKEEMKAAMNNLWDHQRKSEERISSLEKTKQPEVMKNDLRTKERQQPKNVKQTQQAEEETENIFELLQKMINEQSSEAQEPSYNPYMNNLNRRNRPSLNQYPRGFNHEMGNLFSFH